MPAENTRRSEADGLFSLVPLFPFTNPPNRCSTLPLSSLKRINKTLPDGQDGHRECRLARRDRHRWSRCRRSDFGCGGRSPERRRLCGRCGRWRRLGERVGGGAQPTEGQHGRERRRRGERRRLVRKPQADADSLECRSSRQYQQLETVSGIGMNFFLANRQKSCGTRETAPYGGTTRGTLRA